MPVFVSYYVRVFTYFGIDGPLSGREGTEGVFRDGTFGRLGGAAFARRGAVELLKETISRFNIQT